MTVLLEADVAHIPASGRVEIIKQKLESPESGKLLLKALYSSISPGTEYSLMAGQILPLPQKIGYSMVAEVIETGADVFGLKVGDVVVTTAEHASYQIVDAGMVTLVHPDTNLQQAAFFNLGHTALYAIRQASLQLGEACLVMGQGLVGAITAQLARVAGAIPVAVTDIVESRLALAKSMGISLAIDPASEPKALEDVLQGLGLAGFPVVFEATGMREPVNQALEYVGERGCVVMMSQGRDSLSPDALQHLMIKGANLIGGYVNSKPFNLYRSDLTITEQWPPTLVRGLQRHSGPEIWTSDEDIRVFLRLIQHQYLDLSPLISHRFHFSEIPEAYELVWNKSQALMGGIIDWS